MKRWSLAVVCLLLAALVGAYFGGPLLQGQAPATPKIPKEFTSYRDVVKQVLPAVVSIEAKATTKVKGKQPPAKRPLPFDDQRLPEEFRRFFDDFGRTP